MRKGGGFPCSKQAREPWPFWVLHFWLQLCNFLEAPRFHKDGSRSLGCFVRLVVVVTWNLGQQVEHFQVLHVLLTDLALVLSITTWSVHGFRFFFSEASQICPETRTLATRVMNSLLGYWRVKGNFRTLGDSESKYLTNMFPRIPQASPRYYISSSSYVIQSSRDESGQIRKRVDENNGVWTNIPGIKGRER